MTAVHDLPPCPYCGEPPVHDEGIHGDWYQIYCINIDDIKNPHCEKQPGTRQYKGKFKRRDARQEWQGIFEKAKETQ